MVMAGRVVEARVAVVTEMVGMVMVVVEVVVKMVTVAGVRTVMVKRVVEGTAVGVMVEVSAVAVGRVVVVRVVEARDSVGTEVVVRVGMREAWEKGVVMMGLAGTVEVVVDVVGSEADGSSQGIAEATWV